MSGSSSPNVALSLFTIHKVVTRALEVSLEKAQEFLKTGFPDDLLREGYGNYIKAFVSVLESHHMTETNLAFPYFRNLVPEMPYDFLNVQHDIMATYLEEMVDAIRQVESPEGVTSGLTALLLPLSAINDMWHPHIQIEENHLNPEKVAGLLPPEEHLRLITLYGQYSQEHSGPPQLTVPFILFNLAPEPRRVMSKGLPDELVNQLVPVAWKDQWASMTPFLLK
jgi:hemerythrin-like domain-containing protein